MKKGTKHIFLLLLSCLLLLNGCNAPHRAEHAEWGFVDTKTEIEYVACNPIAVKPITLGEVYCEADDVQYYQIEFEDPSRFLCDLDSESGSSIVYRNKDLPEITIENFGAIAAFLYIDGVTPLKVAQLYADDEYLPEELRGQNPQDTDKVQMITDALINGDERTVADSDYIEEDTYYFRLLSADYPGLYYTVCFFGDRYGRYYVEDMATFKIVDAPSEIVAWIIGADDDTTV